MHRPVKYVEKGLSVAANGAWVVFNTLNKIKQNPAFTPNWSDKPLLKSWQKTKPPLGWPRETDSLCPICVIEARQEILDGKKDVSVLLNEKVGEIKATIIERDGKILMVKDCPIHGHFEDVMAIDTEFFKHLEEMLPGLATSARTTTRSCTTTAPRTIKYGRGSVLTVDLTNRCNMMCDPCFMDANQVGFVHELSWEDIKTMLDNAISIKPRRQMSVQFSGGEPTLSPYFLDAVRYARKVGYNSVQAATNGIEFAKSKEFAKAAAEAGLRYAYLQFDGIGNDANSHRQVGNLFDVKLRAIKNLHERRRRHRSGDDDRQRRQQRAGRPHHPVRARQPEEDRFLSFQPVSFTGRDEEITDERRAAQRYTLSHLAHDVKNQMGITEPTRDWFPLSFMGAFADFADLVHGPEADWGQVSCGCHPNCGVGMAVMVDKETKEVVPVPAFLNSQPAGEGHAQRQRRGPRQVAVDRRHGAGAAEELQPVQDADALQAARPAEEVRQVVRRDRQGLRQGRPQTARWTTSRSAARTAGTSCSSPACGSRICSTTTSAAPSCASSRTARRKARSASAPTTPASAGGTSSRTCT